MERHHGKELQEEQNGQINARSTSFIELAKMDGYEELVPETYRFASESLHKNTLNPLLSHDSNSDSHDDLDIYNNHVPISSASYKPNDDHNILMKTISNTDYPSLDMTLKRLGPNIDLTEILNQENGYSLLHLAVFKDSDQIVYAL